MSKEVALLVRAERRAQEAAARTMANIDPPSSSLANVVPLEQAAVRRCQRGEIQGLETLYGIYAERVFRTCFRILGDEAAAEDQTHDVFLRLFSRLADSTDALASRRGSTGWPSTTR